MIVEGIVTTLGPGGEAHVAPMGPDAEGDFRRLVLKPFSTSQTCQNLRRHPEGVFHLVDDVEILARAAIGPTSPAVRPAERVRGFVLLESCRYFEFRAERFDEREERARIECEVVASGRLREFSGFNRARHAVVEAAILATRASFLPLDRIRLQLAQLAVPVEKTGGPRERAAFALLTEHVERIARAREGGGSPGGAPAAVRVRAGSRLHFGLLAPAEGAPRRFGGVGAMVRDPGLEVVASPASGPASGPAASGPLAERAAAFARRSMEAGGRPARIDVRRAPPEHVGLGTGTQLGMAVATAVAELSGERGVPAEELARRAGRGERSGIGLHGFVEGGLLVDGGKASSDSAAPLVARVDIPPSWRFVLLVPRLSHPGLAARGRGLSGEAEREAFRGLARAPGPAAEMSRAVLLGLLPSALEGDLALFGEALGEVGRRAGECFAAVQGGVYSAPEIESLVRWLRSEGVAGAGQSSWGPTVYAVVGDGERAADLVRRIGSRFPGLEREAVVSSPQNEGARVEPVPDPGALPGEAPPE